MLFIAHISTNLGKKICKTYGVPYLKDVINRYQEYSAFIRNDDQEIKEIIENKKVQSFKSGKMINSAEEELMWLDLVPQYWSIKSNEFAAIYQQCLVNQAEPSENIINEWNFRYGKFLVQSSMKDIALMELTQPTPQFSKLATDGLLLVNDYDSEKFEKLVTQVKASGSNETLRWLLLWIKAENELRNKKSEEAFELFKKAFEEAKYSAGNKQYKLVNKYISICAKQNKFKAFKKGVAWANFIGLDIRILRSIDDFNYQDSKHIEQAFDLFKKIALIN